MRVRRARTVPASKLSPGGTRSSSGSAGAPATAGSSRAAAPPAPGAASARFIEENCALSPFVMGKAMTPADPWLFAICTWLEGDGVDIRDTPKLAAHFDMMNARASVAAVRAMGILD